MTILHLALGLAALPLGTGGNTPSLAEEILQATPSEAVMVFSVRDVAGLRERAEAHAWGKFFADPEMKEVWSWLESQGVSWDAMMEESEVPIDPLEFLGTIQDSMAFFVTPVGAEMEPGFGMLFAPGEERGAFEDNFDQLIELMETELVSSADTYEGVELTVFEDEDEDEPDLVVFEAGGVAGIIGAAGLDHGLELAHGVLDRLAGRDAGAGLDANASLADARQSVGGGQSLEFFLDVKSLIALVSAHEGEMDDDEKAIMDAVGITSVRWLYLNADLGEGETLQSNFSVHVPQGSYMARYLDFLRPAPKDMARYLPSESSSLTLGSYDLWGAWQTTLEIIQEHSPESYEQVQGGLDMMSASTGLDIEQDLLAQISGTVAAFTMTVPEEEVQTAMGAMAQMGVDVEGFDQGNATVIGLEDPEIVELFVEDLLEMAQAYSMIEQEEFQGELIQSLAIPGMGGFHWSFTSGALILSEYPTALRASLSMLGQEDAVTALEVSPFKERLRGHMGSAMVSVSDTAQSVRTLLAVGGMLTQMIGSMGLPDDAPDMANLPLPDPDIANKYFEGTMLGSLTRKSDSLTWKIMGQ